MYSTACDETDSTPVMAGDRFFIARTAVNVESVHLLILHCCGFVELASTISGTDLFFGGRFDATMIGMPDNGLGLSVWDRVDIEGINEWLPSLLMRGTELHFRGASLSWMYANACWLSGKLNECVEINQLCYGAGGKCSIFVGVHKLTFCPSS